MEFLNYCKVSSIVGWCGENIQLSMINLLMSSVYLLQSSCLFFIGFLYESIPHNVRLYSVSMAILDRQAVPIQVTHEDHKGSNYSAKINPRQLGFDN